MARSNFRYGLVRLARARVRSALEQLLHLYFPSFAHRLASSFSLSADLVISIEPLPQTISTTSLFLRLCILCFSSTYCVVPNDHGNPGNPQISWHFDEFFKKKSWKFHGISSIFCFYWNCFYCFYWKTLAFISLDWLGLKKGR